MAANLCSKISLSSPIVAIFGATGTGKSKLGIEIAKKFNGEVISVDSMQVYTGLNVITNKVTDSEQRGVPHHLLNFVNPAKGITVIDFRDRALTIIQDIWQRKKLPVLVGGTMYYLEAVLFDFLIPQPESVASVDQFTHEYDVGCDGDGIPSEKKRKFTSTTSGMELYKMLMDVDPEMAGVLLPSDTRKALRCLEVYEKSGVKMSSLLEKQKSQPGATNWGGPLRFPNAVLLWLQCDKNVLRDRLYERVDKMLENGLVQELLDFHEEYNKSRLKKNELPDYTCGIFQAIGFKEFHEYLLLKQEEKESKEGKKLLERCTENLKVSTYKYAKRQLSWIRNRFQRRGDGQMPPIYGLNANDVSRWDEDVRGVAEEIVEATLDGRKPSCEPLPFIDRDKDDLRKIHRCELCDIYMKGGVQLAQHLKGNRHRKMLKRKKKAEEEEQEKASA